MLQVISAVLAALALAPALAHVLELPGKLRLGREAYLEVQTIYYPGFTIAGFAEVGALVATLILVCTTRAHAAAFGLSVAALACLAAMHALFWLVVQPVNKRWVEAIRLRSAGATFFALGGSAGGDWSALRDRWERGHAARAALALAALISLLLAMKV